ncbi:hypothetical protein CPB84DRAFT_134392 [Gymnopilus junonius]|uniref:Uncharacterized protein n=1 Tax=Gymnopilus junonius TaxID=109634 RepID=A0A9P5NIJ0_GYMJU|nr:hypothetical protein CPB84DRAFT_134392 [Gymnopilus junonius]
MSESLGPDIYTESQTLSALLSAISYGVVISLYLLCCHSLLNGRNNYSARKKGFFLSYATILLSLSTIAVVEDTRSLLINTYFDEIFFSVPSAAVIPCGIWAADIFMMWRCVVLYQGSSKVTRIILFSVIVLLLLASIVSGSISLVAQMGDFEESMSFYFLILISISFVVNVTLSLMIFVQIRRHQRNIVQVLGSSYGALYTRIIILFVESCGLIAIWNLGCMISFVLSFTGLQIFLTLFPHILALSPLFVVYRVAHGMEVTTTIEASDLRFVSGVSPTTSQGL